MPNNNEEVNAFVTNLMAQGRRGLEDLSTGERLGGIASGLGRGFLLAAGARDPGSRLEQIQRQKLFQQRTGLQAATLAENQAQRQFERNLAIATLTRQLAELDNPDVATKILQNFSSQLGLGVSDPKNLLDIFRNNSASINKAFGVLSEGFDPSNPQHRQAVNMIARAYKDKDVRAEVLMQLGVLPKVPANDFERAGFALFGKTKDFTPEETKRIRADLKQEKVDIARQTGAEAAARKPLPAEMAKQIGDLGVASSEIDRIERLFKPEYVGPVTGRIAQFYEDYTGDLPEDQIELYAALRDVADALLRARSGAQINEQEFQRMMSFLPSPLLPPKTFRVRLRRFKEATQNMMRQKRKAAGITRGEVRSTPSKSGENRGKRQPLGGF